MHKVGFAIALFLFVVVQLSAQPMSSTDTVGTIQRAVSFERELSWEQILVKAQKEKKLVFVDVVATWCGPCKMMDRDVYSNQKVADEIRGNFIAVKDRK